MVEADRGLRLLILGGTGFIGPHAVRYALARGHEVTIFNRGRQAGWPGEVEQLTGDRETGDLDALDGRTWDVCIDNPVMVPSWIRDVAARIAGHVGHYIYVSTISVYDRNDAPADETAPVSTYTAGDPMAATRAQLLADLSLYGPLKAACEAEAVRCFGAEATTIVRPALIVGPGDPTDRFTYWPARLANVDGRWSEQVAAPGDGSDPIQLIDVRDLAEWMIRLAERPVAGIFNASGPQQPIATREFFEQVAAGVGATPALSWLPTDFLRAQEVKPWADMPVWMPAEGDMAGFHRRSIAAALAAGLTLRPLSETAADTLAWFESLPPERRLALATGLSPEREAALIAAANPD